MTDRKLTERHEDALALTTMYLIPGLGFKRINRLRALTRQRGMSLSSLFELKGLSLLRALPEAEPSTAAMIAGCAKELHQQARTILSRALSRGIQPVVADASDYPAAFKRFLGEAAPPLVFQCGSSCLLDAPGAAVVGTRSPTARGKRAARGAAEHMASQGFCVVSGGAVGVDSAAHEAALSANGATIVMLPQGLETYALPHPFRLPFDEGRVLLLSEELPETPWRTHAAVSRNALICAQARAVCVIEARKQGGSLCTARHAVQQGKPLFAAPHACLPVALQPQARPFDALPDALALILKDARGWSTDVSDESMLC